MENANTKETYKLNTLKNTAKKYTDSNVRHYNCAEVILYAANDYYGLEANSLVLKMIEPFGSGMNSRKACGALTGGVAAIGLMYAKTNL